MSRCRPETNFGHPASTVKGREHVPCLESLGCALANEIAGSDHGWVDVPERH